LPVQNLMGHSTAMRPMLMTTSPDCAGRMMPPIYSFSRMRATTSPLGTEPPGFDTLTEIQSPGAVVSTCAGSANPTRGLGRVEACQRRSETCSPRCDDCRAHRASSAAYTATVKVTAAITTPAISRDDDICSQTVQPSPTTMADFADGSHSWSIAADRDRPQAPDSKTEAPRAPRFVQPLLSIIQPYEELTSPGRVVFGGRWLAAR
jgi:hypothetical protein